ncbi:MAG: peptidase T, partial [Clostridia bacterium]|nr:peptidase T [Clostridia bacterium]
MRAYERLLEYVKLDTTSDENAGEAACPSTPRQKEFAAALVREMRALGLMDAHMDAFGYVYGTLEANCEEKLPVLGLIAHMDTSFSASGKDIRPRIVEKYDGGDITLNPDKQIVMRPSIFESLANYVGQDLIVTDGTTLLGADDKAG